LCREKRLESFRGRWRVACRWGEKTGLTAGTDRRRDKISNNGYWGYRRQAGSKGEELTSSDQRTLPNPHRRQLHPVVKLRRNRTEKKGDRGSSSQEGRKRFIDRCGTTLPTNSPVNLSETAEKRSSWQVPKSGKKNCTI